MTAPSSSTQPSTSPNQDVVLLTASKQEPWLYALPQEVVTEKILPFLDASSIGVCSLLSKQWNRVLTENDPIWRILFERHFFTPTKPIVNFQESYKNFFYNITHNVYASHTLQEAGYENLPWSFAIDEERLFSCSGADIKVWDLETGLCIDTLKGHKETVTSLAIADGKLFSGSDDGTIKIWDLKTWLCTGTIDTGFANASLAIADGMLITRSGDGAIKIWELETNQCTASLPGCEYGGCPIAVAGNKIYSGSGSGLIRIYDLKTLGTIKDFERHKDRIKCLLTANGKLFSGSNDLTIRIWDLQSGACIATLEGHQSGVNSLNLAHGKLISASVDGTIKIWNLETNCCTATFRARRQGGLCSFAIAKGKFVLGYGDDENQILDFTADHNAIFEQIADMFEGDPYRAMELFMKMPGVARDKIYAKLNEYPGLSTNAQRAQEIRAYVGEQPAKQNPSLVHLGISTRKDFSDKLQCRPEHLQKIGILSLEDLKVICCLSEFTKLATVEVKESTDIRQNKINAKNRMCDLTNATQELVEIVDSKIKATGLEVPYTVFQQRIYFQEKLHEFQEKLNEINKQCNGDPTLVMLAYSPEDYNILAHELNAFIERFEVLDRDHQVAKLRAYINQWGILKAWTNRKPSGVHSLAALPASEQTLEKLLKMGE